jgi:hypothetical protein
VRTAQLERTQGKNPATRALASLAATVSRQIRVMTRRRTRWYGSQIPPEALSPERGEEEDERSRPAVPRRGSASALPERRVFRRVQIALPSCVAEARSLAALQRPPRRDEGGRETTHGVLIDQLNPLQGQILLRSRGSAWATATSASWTSFPRAALGR